MSEAAKEKDTAKDLEAAVTTTVAATEKAAAAGTTELTPLKATEPSDLPKFSKSEDPLNPEYDPELKQNGGKFESKFAVWQVTIRRPIDPNPLNIIALSYGFLPFLIPGGFAVVFACTRSFMFLYGLIVSLLAAAVNEALLKPLCNDPRPKGSANRHQNKADGKWEMKHGMPSGHVLNATTLLVWCTLEVALRGPGYSENANLTAAWIVAIILLMGPVPWARWYNQDHSLEQCLVGGGLGIVVGVAAFFVRAMCFPDQWKPWDALMDDAVLNATAAQLNATAVQLNATVSKVSLLL